MTLGNRNVMGMGNVTVGMPWLTVNMRTLRQTSVTMSIDMHMQTTELHSNETQAGGQHDQCRKSTH